MSRRENAGILGLGAAACVACCAGPILAFLGGLAALSLGAAVLVGSVGLFVVGAATAAFVVWRRTRRSSCVAPGPVPVVAPTRRS
jgi:hypothetical protein